MSLSHGFISIIWIICTKCMIYMLRIHIRNAGSGFIKESNICWRYSTGNGVKHQKIPITTILSERASKLASGPQHGFLKKLSRKNLWVQMGQTKLEQTWRNRYKLASFNVASLPCFLKKLKLPFQFYSFIY